jgi:hypothetical protein
MGRITSCVEPGRDASLLLTGQADADAIQIVKGAHCYPADSTRQPSTSSSAGNGDAQTITPEIKSVRFLQVPAADCISATTQVVAGKNNEIERLAAACGFLVGATNASPPNDLSGDKWAKFVGSEEFRGFVHLPSYRVTCSNNQVSAVNVSSGVLGASPGWTPTLVPGPFEMSRVYYEKAEWYKGDGGWHDSNVQLQYPGDRSAVLISFREASRIATASRVGQYAILGYDAPFIWQAVHLRVGCDGSIAAVVAHSTIPRVAAYVSDKQVLTVAQTGSLVDFIRSGGSNLHSSGTGNLDPDCAVDTILPLNDTATTSSSIDCATAASTGALI